MADVKKQEPGWKWFRLSVVDGEGHGFRADPSTGQVIEPVQMPFASHTIAGHTFSYHTEKVIRSVEGETIRVPVAGALDRLWVTGDPATDEVMAVKAKMGAYVVRWNTSRTTANVYQVGADGSKGFRPERDRDEPIAKYLRMEEVPEPATLALV